MDYENNTTANNKDNMNIQDELSKIHHKFGSSEMANYEIQKLFDSLITKVNYLDIREAMDAEYERKKADSTHNFISRFALVSCISQSTNLSKNIPTSVFDTLSVLPVCCVEEVLKIAQMHKIMEIYSDLSALGHNPLPFEKVPTFVKYYDKCKGEEIKLQIL